MDILMGIVIFCMAAGALAVNCEPALLSAVRKAKDRRDG